MSSKVLMPKMGYDMEEGKILRWIKNEGDTVTKGEAIAEIETDKIAIEIEAFASGVLAKILVPAGAMAPVGSPIGLIGEPGEKVEATKAPAASEKKAEAAIAPAAPTPSAAPAPSPAAQAETPPSGDRLKASPLAKKVAAERGVSLQSMTGSGPGGRIVRKDVEAGPQAPVKSAAAAPSASPISLAGQRVPLSAMRKAIARRMTESKAPVPHFYLTMAVDMDAAMALRTQLNEGLDKNEKISINDLIIKACALALRKYPSLNSQFQGDATFHPGEIAVSVAVATENGLIAPDIHQADSKSVGAIAREVKELAERARLGKLTPDDYGRGTFTVSNLGMYGVEEFTAIITLPQSAAIAVGAVQKVPVVKGEQVVPGSVMRFTVSADHRVTDGAGNAQFAAEVKRLLENPLKLLL